MLPFTGYVIAKSIIYIWQKKKSDTTIKIKEDGTESKSVICKMMKFTIVCTWISLVCYITMSLHILTHDNIMQILGMEFYKITKLEEASKEIEIIIVCLMVTVIISTRVFQECLVLKETRNEILNFEFKKDYSKVDKTIFDNTLFKNEFISKFDNILKIDNKKMIDQYNKVEHGWIKELYVLDIVEYEKKCLRAYEQSRQSFLKRLFKKVYIKLRNCFQI